MPRGLQKLLDPLALLHTNDYPFGTSYYHSPRDMYSKVLIIPTFCGAALGAVYNVEVGNGGLNFKPETVSAKAGDTVVFQLFPGHNAVQGDFASPCTPSGQGFYSGPYSDTNSGQLKFVVNVTSSDPVYYYCSVSSHCQLGMVGGINLP